MKTLKLLGAALAAVTMTFTAQAEKTAKAVVEDDGATLKFVYDEADYGTKDDNWFSVAEAEMINPDNEDVPWYGKRSTVTNVVFAESFAAYQPTSVANWFFNFTKLTAVEDVVYWDTSKTTTFYALFAKCSGLTTLNLAGLSTASAKNVGSMFNGCTALTTIAATDSFAVPEAARSNNMFKNCTALVGGNGTPFNGDKTSGEYARIDKEGQPGYFTSPVAKVVLSNDGKTLRFVYDGKNYGTKDDNWFSVAEAEAIDPDSGYVPWYGKRFTVTKVVFDSSFAAYRPKHCGRWFLGFSVLAAVDGLTKLNTSVTTNMAYMFGRCSSLMTLAVTRFDTSNVTDMEGMFYGCSSLTALEVTGFKTANVTSMRSMFNGCSSLTTLDVSGFDTANVTYMFGMFEDCSSLTSIDVSGFDTANVTNMRYMFYGCSSLTTLDVTRFKTANVTNMRSMFNGCSSLTTLDVSGFDTAKVTDMGGMFYGCSSLVTIYVSNKFVTTAVTDSFDMFNDCSSLVGGAGTAYDLAKTDREYARIDGEGGQPGYFTAATVLPEGSYGIRFDANGGTGTMADQICARDKVYNLTKCAFTAPKAFAGWRSSKNGKLYADGILVFALAEPGETVTMTAVWEE